MMKFTLCKQQVMYEFLFLVHYPFKSNILSIESDKHHVIYLDFLCVKCFLTTRCYAFVAVSHQMTTEMYCVFNPKKIWGANIGCREIYSYFFVNTPRLQDLLGELNPSGPSEYK